MTWRIECGDCLELLKALPDGSVDAVVTSPPYNIGNNHHTGNRRHFPYHDAMPENKYQQWQVDILSEVFRVVSENGSVFYNHKNRIQQGRQITPYEWLLRTPWIIKQEVVWHNGGPNFDKIRFYPQTERVYWLAKSPKTQITNSIGHHDVFGSADWPPVRTSGTHKRAFPLEMAADLLSCVPDAVTVLDTFAGSGTTGVACVQAGRNFIGFEIDPHYCEIARKRIGEAESKSREIIYAQ